MQQKAYDGLLEVKLLPGGSIETEEKASSGIFRMYHSGWSMQIEGMELLAVSGGERQWPGPTCWGIPALGVLSRASLCRLAACIS